MFWPIPAPGSSPDRRHLPGRSVEAGRCRHAQLPATDGTVAFAALAGRSRAGKCRLGAIVQLGRLWGACCVHVWATEGVGRVSSHVWGTQNDNCSGPACPAALVPLPTAPAAGSCLCIKGPGQGHEGSWACRLPSLTQTCIISTMSVADELGQPRKSTFSTLSILVQGQRCKSHTLLIPLRPPPAACRSSVLAATVLLSELHYGS